MAKKKQTQTQAAQRAVLADRSLELGHLGQHGELVSLYTATRAWRGGLVGRTGEVALLSAPAIVWTADTEAANQARSKYFIRGVVPLAAHEEPSGARLVVVPLAGLVYACAHGIEAPPALGPQPELDQYGWPRPGVSVHCCTVTHEFRGCLRALQPGEWLELADDAEQAMVNEIADGAFADVLAGKAHGTDHVYTSGIRIALHALTALVVR